MKFCAEKNLVNVQLLWRCSELTDGVRCIDCFILAQIAPCVSFLYIEQYQKKNYCCDFCVFYSISVTNWSG